MNKYLLRIEAVFIIAYISSRKERRERKEKIIEFKT